MTIRSTAHPQGKLRSIRDTVSGSLEALEAGLKKRKEAAEARAVLELLQDTANVVSKVSEAITLPGPSTHWGGSPAAKPYF